MASPKPCASPAPDGSHSGPHAAREPRTSPADRDRLRRVTRLLKILALLQTRHPYGLRDLAEACGCSTKTIQRDFTYWDEMGVPIVYDADAKSYRLIGPPPFRLIDFCLVEATALALAEAAVGASKGLALDASIASAFQRIHDLVPRDVSEQLDGCRAALLADAGAKRDYSKAPLVQLVNASWRRLTVQVDYDSHSSGRRKRLIEPYRIAFLDGFWIVIARDPERGEVRTFALDRIHACDFVRPERPFTIPPGWSVTEYMAGSVGVLRGEKARIALRFEKEAVPWLSGRKWRFPNTVSEPDADGSVTLSGTVAGLEEITGEVLRWGRHVTVLEPEALRAKVAEEARAIAARYAP